MKSHQKVDIVIKLPYCNHDHICFVSIIIVTSYSVKEVEEDAVATNVNEKPSEGCYCYKVSILQP